MKMRIEMKKNPDPISTIEIKRENQNTKFLDFFFFVCGMEKKEKWDREKGKEKKGKWGWERRRRIVEREREREVGGNDGDDGSARRAYH